MLRLIFLLVLLLAAPARAQPLPSAAPLHPSAAFTPLGPEQARGVLVWLHGSSDTDTQPSPPEPAWVRRAADRGYDIWRFDRTPGHDPLAAGAEILARGLAALRQGGYRRVIVAGHSRGAWIALSALAQPGLVDGVAAFSPAAHGASAARREQALADFSALVHAAVHAPDTRVVYASFGDDPLDPGPEARLAMMRDVAEHRGLKLLPIVQPKEPNSHMGVYEKKFDQLFGALVMRFLDPEAKRIAPRPRAASGKAPT